MTNAEKAEIALNEMYNFMMSSISAGTAALGGALAQLNSYTFGFEAYTYNAFGFQGNFASQPLFASFDAAINNNLNLTNKREVA